MTALEESYLYCRSVARSRAKNFYYSFMLLEGPRRDAMCAVYAFMRYCDDLSDEPGATTAAIERWRSALDEALAGRFDGHPCWPAFHKTVERYAIPRQYFEDMIDGVSSDLTPRRFETFDDLYRYCYQVASVAGLTTIHILGFTTPEALPLAEKCGVAFQLTNILRDIKEDAGRGRLYFPAEDLRRFGLSSERLAAGGQSRELVGFLKFQVARARSYYEESLPLVDMVSPHSRPSLKALISIYSKLLERIERRNYDVFTERIALSAAEKCWLVLKALAS
jgi:15-cis-phytoene synthase